MTAQMDTPIPRPTLWSLRLRGSLVAVVALAAAVLGAVLLSNAKPSVRIARAEVVVSEVRDGVFHDYVALRSEATPKDVVYLDALEGGQVQQVLAHAGDKVRAGQPLVLFRNTELELEVLDREGRLVEAITQLQAYGKQLEETHTADEKALEQIRYDIQRLERLSARREALLEKGYISREAHETVHDELEHNRRLLPLQTASNRQQDQLRERQRPQIQSELRALQQSLQVTRSKLDNLLLRAPVSGRLTDTDLKIGEIRTRGQRLGQIVADTGYQLQARLDEFYLDRVRVSQTGTVDVDGKTYPVTVRRVDPQVKNATFQIDLSFGSQSPAGLLPGQSLEGRLMLGGDRQSLLLPAGAYLEKTGGDWVMVVRPDGRSAERRRIRLGRRNPDQVEVLEGLRPGDRVITSDYSGFERIDRVDLTK